MPGPEAIVREVLTELASAYRREDVTDPRWIAELLAPRLAGRASLDEPVVRAAIAATDTTVLRALQPGTSPGAAVDDLTGQLLGLGHGAPVARAAAEAWVLALVPGAVLPPTPPPGPAVLVAEPPDVFADTPAEAPPVGATAPSFLPPPVAPPRPPAAPPRPPTAFGPDPRPMPVAGLIGGPLEHPGPTGWPAAAKRTAAILAVLALVGAAFAAVGWWRDPSKERASSAEERVTALQQKLDSTTQTLTGTQGSLTERTKQLEDAKAQIGRLSTLTRAQLNGAVFPEQFTMTGKVAPGSCSLTGDACNVSAALRSVKVGCGATPCDCTAGKCTVTSELWRTASAVTFDPATNLFVARGLLDGDVFRCAGVAQPTNYEFRFRVTKVTFADGAWRVSGVDAELAQASSAGSECLAGNRTYMLGSQF